MTRETFRKRLESGKSNHSIFEAPGREGVVTVWIHQGSYVLTWEECPPGEQYNEHLYTRDERHLFETLDDLLAFLDRRGLPLDQFHP